MLFRKFLCLSAISFAFLPATFGQSSINSPRQEKLLNGLRVLMWSDASSPKVFVKLRVHAGASFDPQEKEGVMKLLSTAIFPSEDAREFFRDDLGGDLSITCNYDYIEINASSKPDSYLRMLETLASAVTTPVLDKAVTETVKTKLAATVAADEKNAAYVADLAVRKRLFQTFPYGRPINGSSESLKKIDFADLRFAYDRLFGADNATLAISGNFPNDVGFRATRRFFGAWLKSDKKVPSTFRQPDPPVAGIQIVTSPEASTTEIRYAVRGVARGDKDHAAATILARIYEQRLRAKAPDDQKANVFVQNDANILPGVMIFAFTRIKREMTAEVSGERPKVDGNDIMANALGERISDGEYNAARTAAVAEFERRDQPTQWLDADTFRLASVKAGQQSFTAVSLPDVQDLADRMKQRPIASVVVLPTKGTN